MRIYFSFIDDNRLLVDDLRRVLLQANHQTEIYSVNWQDTIPNCDAFIYIHTPAAAQSPRCHAEMLLADQSGDKLIRLVVSQSETLEEAIPLNDYDLIPMGALSHQQLGEKIAAVLMVEGRRLALRNSLTSADEPEERTGIAFPQNNPRIKEEVLVFFTPPGLEITQIAWSQEEVRQQLVAELTPLLDILNETAMSGSDVVSDLSTEMGWPVKEIKRRLVVELLAALDFDATEELADEEIDLLSTGLGWPKADIKERLAEQLLPLLDESYDAPPPDQSVLVILEKYLQRLATTSTTILAGLSEEQRQSIISDALNRVQRVKDGSLDKPSMGGSAPPAPAIPSPLPEPKPQPAAPEPPGMPEPDEEVTQKVEAQPSPIKERIDRAKDLIVEKRYEEARDVLESNNAPSRGNVDSKSSLPDAPLDEITHLLETPPHFTAFWPDVVEADKAYTLLAFVHLNIESVQEQVRKVAADFAPAMGHRQQMATAASNVPLAEGTILTLLPQIDELKFEAQTIVWQPTNDNKLYQRVVFPFHTPVTIGGRSILTGRILILQGPLVLGEIPLTMRVERGAETNPQEGHLQYYGTIFASYSHRDAPVMEYFRRARQNIGQKMLVDIYDLRVGEHWSDQLLHMIDESAIFQLFWSENSANSPYCQQEWLHALNYQDSRPRFIQPVWWQGDSLSPSPPPELAHIHFQKISLPPATRISMWFGRIKGMLGG